MQQEMASADLPSHFLGNGAARHHNDISWQDVPKQNSPERCGTYETSADLSKDLKREFC